VTFDLLVAIVVAAAVVGGGLYTIHRWGPRREARAVRCPEKKTEAQIVVERREGSFAALMPPDVAACSLLPEGKVDCEKKCLAPGS
jgi:hypothetical protein